MAQFHNLSRYEALSTSLPLTAGKIFFVADSADAWYERLQNLFPPDVDGEVRLFSNLDTAVGACVVNRGDVIVVFPNYTMTVSTAGGLTLDVAGITLLGLGNKGNRPIINFTTATTADVEVDSANITIDNFEITCSFDAVDGMFDIDADYFTLRNCRILMTSGTTIQASRVILADSTNVVSSMLIENNDFIGDTTVGVSAAVRFSGGANHVIRNNRFWGNFDTTSGGAIVSGADATSQLTISGNIISNMAATSAGCVRLLAATTGEMYNNYLSITLDTAPTGTDICLITAGSMRLFENQCSTDSGEVGSPFGAAVSGGTPST